jgi:hypothetical protein
VPAMQVRTCSTKYFLAYILKSTSTQATSASNPSLAGLEGAAS